MLQFLRHLGSYLTERTLGLRLWELQEKLIKKRSFLDLSSLKNLVSLKTHYFYDFRKK